MNKEEEVGRQIDKRLKELKISTISKKSPCKGRKEKMKEKKYYWCKGVDEEKEFLIRMQLNGEKGAIKDENELMKKVETIAHRLQEQSFTRTTRFLSA